MKANELMIGDYVLYQGNPHRVYRILPDTVPFADTGRMKEDLVHIVWNDVHEQVNVNNLEPIPLTPEILEKNGFSCRGAWCLPGEDLGLRQDGDSWGLLSYYAEYDALAFCHIKYVHQLQHALQLCDIEKEIKL